MTPIILPCAGKGTRLGMDMPKAAVEICGKPLLQHTIELIEPCKERPVVVVTGYKSYMLAKDYGEHVYFVHNKFWEDGGVLSSIHAGVVFAEQLCASNSDDVRFILNALNGKLSPQFTWIMDGDIIPGQLSVAAMKSGAVGSSIVGTRQEATAHDPAPIYIATCGGRVACWSTTKVSGLEWGCLCALPLNSLRTSLLTTENKTLWEFIQHSFPAINVGMCDGVEVDTPEGLAAAEDFVRNGYKHH